jgi:hypothetical protein
MKKTLILTVVLLQFVVEPVLAQREDIYFPKTDTLTSQDAQKMALERFLKLRPTYKLLSFSYTLSSASEIVSGPCYSYKELQRLNGLRTDLAHITKGTISFYDIDVMNGDKKTRLTPKYYVIK